LVNIFIFTLPLTEAMITKPKNVEMTVGFLFFFHVSSLFQSRFILALSQMLLSFVVCSRDPWTSSGLFLFSVVVSEHLILISVEDKCCQI